MLDPVSAIAFEMQAAKGVFALLLGSGLSRSAKIPTGWEITLDLVRRLAALKGEQPEPDPAGWYVANFGQPPDYSGLLDQLATAPTLRQQVIRPYIEPTEEERGRGEKLPTRAHRAIAGLMAKGYVKVVLTTNFDHLLEQALTELGITPAVISTADQIAGALPLVHSGPVIVKLHGDYTDTRIRNTVGELSAYEPAIDALLDQVLDEFGLIVCGWSAEWDPALRAAIDRAPSRRFPMYWAVRGTAGEAASALVTRRKARLVPINDADAFFDGLSQRVNAIDSLRQPHPLSTEIAVAMLKEYLPEPRHAIRLHDLLSAEFDGALARLEQPHFAIGSWSTEAFAEQVQQYQAAMDQTLALAYTAGLWSSSEQAFSWVDFVVTLASRRKNASGPTPLVDLRAFPATLVLYAFGLGAIAGRRPQLLGLFTSKKVDMGDGAWSLGDRLNIGALITDGGADRFKAIATLSNKRLAGSELIAGVLRPLSRRELRGDEEFDAALARLELALAFGFADRTDRTPDWFWVPPGRFIFNRQLMDAIVASWRADFEARGEQSELSVMASLSKAPKFDQLREHFAKVPFWG